MKFHSGVCLSLISACLFSVAAASQKEEAAPQTMFRHEGQRDLEQSCTEITNYWGVANLLDVRLGDPAAQVPVATDYVCKMTCVAGDADL